MTQKFSRLKSVLAGLLMVGLLVWPGDSQASSAVSGRAIGLKATVGAVDLFISDTGNLPPTGGTRQRSVADVNASLPLGLGNVSASIVDAFTTGSIVRGLGGKSFSEATTADLELNLALLNLPLPVSISAEVIDAEASAECKTRGNPPARKGNSTITNLKVNGLNVAVTSAPNQRISLRDFVPELPEGLDVAIIINEQKRTSSGREGSITVNAIHVIVKSPFLPTDIIVSSAKAHAGCLAR